MISCRRVNVDVCVLRVVFFLSVACVCSYEWSLELPLLCFESNNFVSSISSCNCISEMKSLVENVTKSNDAMFAGTTLDDVCCCGVTMCYKNYVL